LELKRTKLDFGWDSTQDPGGEDIALHQSSSWISEAYF